MVVAQRMGTHPSTPHDSVVTRDGAARRRGEPMQLRTRETGVTAKDQLTVDAHRSLGYAQHGDVLAWDVFQEQQHQMVREIEAMSGAELTEVINGFIEQEEHDALPLTGEDDSPSEAPSPVVDEVAEHDDGCTSVQCDVPSMEPEHRQVQEAQTDSTSVPVGHKAYDIPLIKVNFT